MAINKASDGGLIGGSTVGLLQTVKCLPEKDQMALNDQLSRVPLDTLDLIIKEALKVESAGKDVEREAITSSIQPLPASMLTVLSSATVDQRSKWSEIGVNALKLGQVAIVLLAGGMGTRLGYTGPKGTYDFGLSSHRSLFQLHAEKLLKLEQLYKCPPILWFILVSQENDVQTKDYFKKNAYFGLQRSQVIFFLQQEMPCVTIQSPHSLLLKSRNELSSSPDGNGGVFGALFRHGCLDEMKRRNIEYIHVFGVDNCLILPADPLFIGYCLGRDIACGAKVVPKKHAHESVGVFCQKNGHIQVIEYSELSADLASKTMGSSDQLVFNSANIVNHFFTRQFIEKSVLPRLNDPTFMPYHIARKKVPFFNPVTNKIDYPESPNALKLERFIFDVFAYVDDLEDIALLQVDREQEFAPIKNAPGNDNDSPDTARQLYHQRCCRWLQLAGATVDTRNSTVCEISPFVSFSGEGLSVVNGKTLVLPVVINSPIDLEKYCKATRSL